MASDGSKKMLTFAISISYMQDGTLVKEPIGFTEAESMEDLMKKLDIGTILRTILEPRSISIYFDVIVPISSPGDLAVRLRQVQQ